jgi:hypothetical protein
MKDEHGTCKSCKHEKQNKSKSPCYECLHDSMADYPPKWEPRNSTPLYIQKRGNK